MASVPDSPPATSLISPAARRPRRTEDSYGLALTTSPEAAAAYGVALDRLLTLEVGVEEHLLQAVRLDPSFSLAHAVLATVLAEEGASTRRVRSHLHAARQSSHRATEREASFVTSAVLWCSKGLSGDAPLVRHVRRWPRDVYAVSMLAPSIASAGVADGVVEVWPLLDELVASYGDDWWLTSIRAFARTEQHCWSEAEDLALAAFETRPASGHAGHALAHVLYETGRHEQAVEWVDTWRGTTGRWQRFGGHFSWHAALAQLAQGDIDGVRARFDRELRGLRGNRALVDAGSMLVRCAAHGAPLGDDRVRGVAHTVGDGMLAPASPFLAWHVAVFSGLRGDAEVLDRCEGHAHSLAGDGQIPARQRDGWGQVASVCRALRFARDDDHATAAALLLSLGDTAPMGGSPAQRELLEDLALRELVAVGEDEAAAQLARRRLRRRGSAFDEELCARLP